MIIERATCGHFAAWDLDGKLVHRICRCADLRQPRAAAADARSSHPAVASQLTRCPKCEERGRPGLRVGSGPHSPHLRGKVLVDCAGDEVSR